MPRPDDYEDGKSEPVDHEEDDDGEPEKFDDSSLESDDDAHDRYERDDFIVDDVEDDEGADDVDVPRQHLADEDEDDEEVDRMKKKKKKKRRHHEDPDLVEGDLVLLEDNGVRVNRNKRLKRLRKSSAEDDVDDELAEDVRNLAHDDDDERYEEDRRRVDEPVDYEDDMDDFIDDGGRGRRRRAAERGGLVSSEAVRTARSIFGDIEEISKYKGASKLLRGDGDDEDDEDYGVDGAADEAPADRLRKIRERGTNQVDDDDDADLPPSETADRAESGAIAKGLSKAVDNKDEIEEIVKSDIPEHLQYHFGPDYKRPTDIQIRDEANWIYRRGFLDNPKFNGDSRYQSGQIVQKIIVILSYIHIDKLDIPFIAMHRKDYISSILIPSAGEYFRKEPPLESTDNPEPVPPMAPPRGFNSLRYEDYNPAISFEHLRGVRSGFDDGFGDWSILWLILDLDKKYADMSLRRSGLISSLDDALTKGVPLPVLNDLRSILEHCDEESDFRDCERHLRHAIELADALNKDRMGEVDEEDGSRKSRRPSRRRNRYADFCKRGYRSLAKEFGITAKEFGDNLKGACDYGAGTQVHVPIDCDSEPIYAAKLLLIRSGEMTGDPDDIDDKIAERALAAARFVMVTEVSSDINVLQAARRILCRPGTVTVTTTPTAQGIAQVDDTHPLRSVTCLSEKKIETFSGTAEFALIRRAEELGFTNMVIQFRDEQVDIFLKHLGSSILVEDSSSNLVGLWNKHRTDIVERVHKLLVKTMMDEVRFDLEEDTSVVLRYKLSNAASRRFLLGPSRSNPYDDGCPRVLAFTVTSEDDEEADPIQTAKDAEDAKDRKDGGERRVAPERITVVNLDENGEYVSGYELFASWLRRPMRRDLPDGQLSSQVKEQLRTFILKSKANVIVIGIGSGRRAPVRLRSDLMDVIKDMVVGKKEAGEDASLPVFLTDSDIRVIHNAATEPEEVEKILSKYIVFCDDAPCRVYAKTNWSMAGLSVDAMTLLEKKAVALARFAQEPLWVYCAIGQEKELASRLQFHPYHFYAKSADRLIALHRALVRAVCTSGIDINRSLRLPHTQSMVAFVSGLGVHKGKALLKELGNVLSEGDRGLKSRKQLWSHNFIGKTVFLSTAAFLRVRDPELHPGGSTKRAVEIRRMRLGRKPRARGGREDDVCDPLDDSRIHPEHYAIAVNIADEALRDDQGRLTVDIPDSGDYPPAIRKTAAVLDTPSRLKRLALDKYAIHLESIGRGSLFEMVKMIANEFQGPYRDHRQQLISPEPKAMFYIVTGADPILLRQGSAVTATDCQVRMSKRQSGISGISCFLPDGIRGFIPPTQFSDRELDPSEVQSLVPLNCSLACRIIEFNFQKFEAVLTSKISVKDDPSLVYGYVPIIDKSDVAFRPYPKKGLVKGLKPMRPGGVERGPRSHDLQRKKTMSSLTSADDAVITHSLFKNFSGEQAIEVLRSSLPGDILIRPSQYVDSEIVFSCKFGSLTKMPDNRSILHIPCRVVGEGRNGDIAQNGGNAGPYRYKIEGNTYEQVDQALEEYVRPIISNMSEALDNRKFREGTVDELVKYVAREKLESPTRIPYLFGLSEKRPASLVLIFIPGSKSVVQEEINVIPNGYRFRQTLYINVEKLISWFKGNMAKGGAARRPVTAREAAAGFQSPYMTAASPFPSASPFPQPTRSEYPARGAATPVNDIAPPPAPMPVNAMERYSYPGSARRDDYGALGQQLRPDGTDWSKARRQVDEPPPSVQNGDGFPKDGRQLPPTNFDRRGPPAPPSVQNGDGFPKEGRQPPPTNFDRRGPPGQYGNPADMQGQRRDGNPADMQGQRRDGNPGDMQGQRRDGNPADIQGQRRDGNPADMQGQRRDGRPDGRGSNGNGGMPEWRGQAPVPAWKKANR